MDDDFPLFGPKRYPVYRSKTEYILQEALERLGLKPVHSYKLSKMVVDFAFPEKKVAIEVDGPYHLYQKQTEKDSGRSKMAESMGWLLVRLTSKEVVENPSLAAQKVKRILETR